MNTAGVWTDGSSRFNFFDGLPLGSEVVSSLASGTPREVIGLQLAKLQIALRAFRADVDTWGAQYAINENFRIDPVPLPSEMASATRQGVLDWLVVASPGDLQTFLAANVADNKRRQAALKTVEPNLNANVSERAARLRAIGYLPKESATVYEQAIEWTGPRRCMDFFAGGGTRASAYFDDARGWVFHYLPALDESGLLVPKRALYMTDFHEFTHVAGFRTGGFLEWGNNEVPLHRWAEESFAAHTTAVSDEDAVNPEPEIIDPAQRSDPNGIGNKCERTFLHLVTQEASQQIDVLDLSAAFYAPRHFDAPVRRRVFLQLNRNIQNMVPGYRTGGLRELSYDYETAYRRQRHTGWLYGILSEMGV